MPGSKKILSFLERSSWIRKMFEEGARMKAELGEDRVFDFSLGNPSEEPPPEFRQEILKLMEGEVSGIHRYMSNAGFEDVRGEIAKALSQDSGLPLTADHIIMTVGASGAMNVILKALLDPGEEVIVFSPYFVEYRFYIDNYNGVPVEVPTDDRFNIDLAATEKAITKKTKALIVNSPNNPTGVIYSPETLAGLAELLKQKERQFGTDIYLIYDEPYRKLVYDGIEPPYVFQYVDNAIAATSHSKDLALAGERIGYITVGPKAAHLDDLFRSMVFCNRTLGFVNAPALMQKAVAKLQQVSVDIASYQKRRDLLCDQLSRMGYEMIKPQGAFYLFPKSPDSDDISFIKEAQKRHILMAPGSGFGRPGYFRLAYSVSLKVIENALPAFEQLAKHYGLKG
jgi:aspartate aminotransferase